MGAAKIKELRLKKQFEVWSCIAKDEIIRLPDNELWLKKIYPAFEFLVQQIWKKSWRGACHDTSAALYVVLNEIGIDAKLYIGEVMAGKAFDHSLVEVNGLIVDAAVSLPKAHGKAVGGPIFAGIDLDSGVPTSLKFGVFELGLGNPANRIVEWDLDKYVKESGSDIWRIATAIGSDIGLNLEGETLRKKYGTCRRTLISS